MCEKTQSPYFQVSITCSLTTRSLTAHALLTVEFSCEVRVIPSLPSRGAVITLHALLPRVTKNLDAEALMIGVIPGEVAI